MLPAHLLHSWRCLLALVLVWHCSYPHSGFFSMSSRVSILNRRLRRKRQSQYPLSVKRLRVVCLQLSATFEKHRIGHISMNRAKRSPLFLMALTIFIDFAGFGLVLPLLPFWAERLGASPVGVGLAITIYALAQFVFTPVLGSLSDRYGRRPVILASLLIEALSLALAALAGSLPILFIARFIGGLGASNIGSAQAVVADVTPVEGRARGMGLIGAAIGLGFVVGPALGGALAPLGTAVPFWVAMLVALANALLVLRFLPETRWMGTTRAPVSPAAHGTGAFTAMETVFVLFTQHTFGWTAMQNGYIFTYIGVLIVLMQGGLVGLLV